MTIVRQVPVLLLIILPLVASAESLDAAKEALDAGTPGEAESILSDINKEEDRDELFYLLAETARQYEHYSEAGNQLNRIEDPAWASMGYFNLAMSHLENESFRRAKVALQVTRSMAAPAKDPAASEMANRAHIVEGLLALRAGNPGSAVSSFSAVSTDSVMVPQGLYLLGIARARSGKLHRAIQTWQRVESFPAAVPGVVEARIARVWAHREQQQYRQALTTTDLNRGYLDSALDDLSELRRQVGQRGVESIVSDEVNENESLVDFLRAGRNLSRSTPMAWFYRFLETGGRIEGSSESVDAQFLDFLDEQETLLQRFQDRTLQQQATLFERIALENADERPMQRGGWE